MTALALDDRVHGILSTYERGCRCPLCKEACRTGDCGSRTVGDRSAGVELRQIAATWPASWNFVGGISYRSLRYSRMAAGEVIGSGGRAVYFTDDIRRLVLRHALTKEIGGGAHLPLSFDPALNAAIWINNDAIVNVGALTIRIALPAAVFEELAP